MGVTNTPKSGRRYKLTQLRMSQSSECHSPGAKRFKQASDDEEEVKQNDSLPSLTTTSHAPHSLIEIEQRLCTDLLKIDYSPCGVQYVYNPLDYASETHSDFVLKYGNGLKKILFLGMNPGPFGMAQNGVPFGDVSHVKDWLRITGTVHKPAHEHPKRPILGLESTRNEVSGTRFWNLMKKLAKTPENFFRNCYVHNYCPLCFMTESGKNVTPSSLKVAQKEPLQSLCDRSLVEVVTALKVEVVVGVGGYARERGKRALKDFTQWNVEVKMITHPSPINPAANKDWISLATGQLEEMGVEENIRWKEKE